MRFWLLVSAVILCTVVGLPAGEQSSVTRESTQSQFASQDLLADHIASPFQMPARKHCFYTYGTQPDFPKNAQGCSRAGASGCGGPDQCFCGANERLVTFKCGAKYFHMCWSQDVGC